MRYKIEYLGIELTDYFQGYGTAFTPYDYAVVGCGETMLEALDDAMESLAQCEGTEPVLEAIDADPEYHAKVHELSKTKSHKHNGPWPINCDCLYWYGVLYSLDEPNTPKNKEIYQIEHYWDREHSQEQTERLFDVLNRLLVAYKFFVEHSHYMDEFYALTCKIDRIFSVFEFRPAMGDRIRAADYLLEKEDPNPDLIAYWNFLALKFGEKDSLIQR